MSETTDKLRRNITRDREKLRRLRRRYLRRLKDWIEEDRERIYFLAKRMKEIGLFAKTSSEGDIRCGIINTLAWVNGKQNYNSRWKWINDSGWREFWGYMGSEKKRIKP